MTVVKHKQPRITSLDFLSRLRWLDGKPLQIEEYRKRIFSQVLNSRRPDGTPTFNQALLGRGKKNYKSCDLVLAAFYCTVVRRAVQGNDAIVIASDEAQAGDDLSLAKKLIEVNRETLGAEFETLAKELRLRDGSGGIKILPAGDAAGLHGKQYSFLGADEVHTQNDWSVLEALQPDPTRLDTLVWITSYDSVTDAEGQPLHDLKKLGMSSTDPKFFFSWYSGDYCTDPAFADLDPEARANPSMSTWQEGRAYLDQQRARLPQNIFKRLHLNLPSTAESFIDMKLWDACIDPDWREVLHDRSITVYVGVDVGVKHDATAVVAVYFDHAAKVVKLVFHRVFVPPKSGQLDLRLVGDTIRTIGSRYRVAEILYDPNQMQAIAQELARDHFPMTEFPQTQQNLTLASENLFQLIQQRNIVLYPDAGMRLAASRAIATEMPRGWRFDKAKQSHKVDVIVALSMAAHAAIEGQAHQPLIVRQEHIELVRSWPKRRGGLYGGASWGEQMYGERKWLQMTQMRRRF